MPVLQATNMTGAPFNVGVYPARVLGTNEAKATENSKFDKGLPRLAIQLRVSYRGETVDFTDYITLYPKLPKRSKGYSLFSAAQFEGGEIPEGSDLDTDDLVNSRVQIVVRPKPDGSGNMIESYMARPTEAVAAPKKASRRVVEDDEDDDLTDMGA